MSMLKMSAISEGEFHSVTSSRRLFSHEHARRFASVSLSSSEPLAISWRSDLIEPSIIEDERLGVAWIAVDDRAVGVTLHGQVVFSMAMQTPVLSLEKCSGGIVVITETQAVVINENCTVRSIIEFPGVAQDFSMNKDQLTVGFAECDDMAFSL